MKRKSFLIRVALPSIAAVLATLSFKGTARPPATSFEVLRGRLAEFAEPKQVSDLQMNIDELDRRGLMSGAAGVSIWSGDYWALRYGAISAQYKDKGGYQTGLTGLLSWKPLKKKFDQKWSRKDPRALTPEEVYRLSPAEKMDLVLSDYDLTLSRNVWKSVVERYQRGGAVHMWEGFCHGWSPASIQAPRPVKTVNVRSRDGRYEVPFTPSDIKGLATYLWGESLIQEPEYTVFMGARCSKRDLRHSEYDPLTGIASNPNCQGVDAALFHLSLMNVMGIEKGSFVINRDTGAQVWNQPLHSYQAKYFNLVTGQDGDLASSLVPIEMMEGNIHAGRAPETKYLVGVNLELKYVKETRPNRAATDDPSKDYLKTITYMYDLELDADHNVIGGKWRNYRTDQEALNRAEENAQVDFPGYPGFIWKIKKSETKAFSVSDPDDGTHWKVGDPIPNQFLDFSKMDSTFQYKIWKTDAQGNRVTDDKGFWVVDHTILKPQPVSQIVHGLLRAAKDPNDPRDLM